MTTHVPDGTGTGHAPTHRLTGHEPSPGDPHDRLDITQLVFCGLAVGLLLLGVNRVGEFHNPTHTAFLAAITTLAFGGAFFAIAWIRTIWFHYVRDVEPADIRLPDLSVTNVNRVTAWMVPFVISAGLLAAPETYVRWAAVVPVVGTIVLFVFWREYPTYAFPIIDSIGITRAVALTVGAIAALRALIDFRTADHVSLILLIVAGSMLSAAAIERWPGIGRRRGNKLRDRVASLEHKVFTLEKAPSERGAVATADHRRPRWLIILIAVACAVAAGYALWRAINLNGRSSSDIIALLVFVGFALILAVGGERLTNLTFKAGMTEVTIGLETDATKAGGADRSGAVSDVVERIAAGTLKLEHLNPDELGEHPTHSLPSPYKIRQLTVRGNADDVAAILGNVLPSV